MRLIKRNENSITMKISIQAFLLQMKPLQILVVSMKSLSVFRSWLNVTCSESPCWKIQSHGGLPPSFPGSASFFSFTAPKTPCHCFLMPPVLESGRERLTERVDPGSVDIGDVGSIPGSGRSPGRGNGNPLQHSCQDNPWTEESGGPQSTVLQRDRHIWVTEDMHAHTHTTESPYSTPGS